MSLVMVTTRYAVLSLVSLPPQLLPVADAFTAPILLTRSHQIQRDGSSTAIFAKKAKNNKSKSDDRDSREKLRNSRRKEWVDRSIRYYSTVMREQQRTDKAHMGLLGDGTEDRTYVDMACRHYFALRKIKRGELRHAESIYRRTIQEIMDEDSEDGGCDHARLAVSTLLLALLMQRMRDVKGTRSVFNNFFRVAVIENGEKDCACSAKVLQAYALFEMKQGHSIKSLELVTRAVQMDERLKPVLEWKQFRDVKNTSS
eukprot:CAMPEP_0185730626 /NCGR_PEP_ID=MMETSP1171-20130828/10519_1 /TAXON_ID=374046 /ORGANISM="Helicotheca tamensis, Strain CCMP826" /LENGTH=256 /DNA_ID=CAMNT_0028399717 /DNA_START=192 /DNA_END=965 /DNA_ORIENTATION=+